MSFIISKIKSFFLVISRLLNRALCCVKRKRRSSQDEDSIVMDSILVTGPTSQADALTSWSNWSDEPRVSPVEQKIQQYRSTLVKPPSTEQEPEPEPDYFNEMKPRLTRPKQMVFQVADSQAQPATSIANRLAFQEESITLPTTQFGEWEEENTGGWQEVEDPDLDSILQEQKRLQREQRFQDQLKRKQDKQGKKVLATKLT